MKLIKEENLTENLDFYSEMNPKKETILFLSEDAINNKKIKEKQNYSLISNPTTVEEQNKSTKSNSTMNNSEEKVKFKFSMER